ncbi:Ig-like domain-containing protein, partial [Mesorhizobium sp. B2-4-17]
MATINGTNGKNTITGTALDDVINALGGDDIVSAAGGNDQVYGGDGNDKLSGGIGNDLLHGDAGDDLLNGDDGNDTLYGDAGADDLRGGLGNDFLYGGIGNDSLRGDEGDDTLNGGDGADILDGGVGNDSLDGGSGSDQVKGGGGNDLLIYNATENVGASDVYDGAGDTDTLRLDLTLAQWQSAALQSDIARYLQVLAKGGAEDFVFTAFGLDVKNVEILKVFVDGVEQNPVDEAVVARDDAFGVTEDTISLTGNVLGNDSVPDLVLSVAKTSNPSYGSVVLTTPSGNFTYTPNTAILQTLAAGESLTDSFTYKVTDSDGDASTATVTITVTGTNDAPVITVAGGDSAAKTLAETN